MKIINESLTKQSDILNDVYNSKKEKKARQTIKQRLDEIDKKDIKYLEKQANSWGKTLVNKNLLTNLKDFDFWKEWKNK